MKEITRRLYTKPVMLALAFLVGVGLVVGLLVTTRSATATTIINAGDDKFETTGNGETYHNFAASKIPADFFGPGSAEYSGVVPLVGVPLPGQGDIDTIIHRNQTVTVPGSTTLTMTALSLKSINNITVTYPNGTEQWSVRVGLSAFKASTGSMNIGATTFDSSLKVWPKFTFTRIPDGAQLELDTGDPNGPGLTAASDGAVIGDGGDFEPVPAPTIAPCPVIIGEFEGQVGGGFSSATATSSCAPVTLTANNVPWLPCGFGGFCIPRPLTEAELLAAHNASPPGTKKKILAVKEPVVLGD